MADITTAQKHQGPFTGGCACRAVRYTLQRRPIRINACHCRYCQRETGTAFALNAIYEPQLLTLTTETQPERVDTPAASGKPQVISRCPICRVAVWSNYPTYGDKIVIVRVGTLDEPDTWGFEPEAHIFTSTKQPWVVLNDNVPIVEEWYLKDYWPKESLDRFDAAIALKADVGGNTTVS